MLGNRTSKYGLAIAISLLSLFAAKVEAQQLRDQLSSRRSLYTRRVTAPSARQ